MRCNLVSNNNDACLFCIPERHSLGNGQHELQVSKEVDVEVVFELLYVTIQEHCWLADCSTADYHLDRPVFLL